MNPGSLEYEAGITCSIVTLLGQVGESRLADYIFLGALCKGLNLVILSIVVSGSVLG
jgi:hypothetical protein